MVDIWHVVLFIPPIHLNSLILRFYCDHYNPVIFITLMGRSYIFRDYNYARHSCNLQEESVFTLYWKMKQNLENGTTDIKNPTKKCQVYRIRWFVLVLFVMYSAINSLQWIQFSIIADVITEFYGVEYLAVNWTSQIYMVLYIPFIFPASYLLDKLVSK